jgi:inner membrane protein
LDNFCHTLVGATLGEAGLKTRTPFASATLVVASNLPDIDVLIFATDIPAVSFRRGWTHGVLAQALLPIALAGIVAFAGRHRGARFAPLVLLSYIGVLSHVALDWLNSYGIRLLMPFSNRWFYGDAVFIVDLWLWLVLGAGAWFSLRRDAPRPARVALGVAAVYVAVMVASALAARGIVLDEWQLQHSRAPRSMMVGPMPLTPFQRQIIVDAGDHYRTGVFTWFDRRAVFDTRPVPKNDREPAAELARRDLRVQAVLRWARFPYYTFEAGENGTHVMLSDVRFGPTVGAIRVLVREEP